VHAWTKSACVVLAWSLLMIIIVMAAGLTRPDRLPQADIRIASNTTQAAPASTLGVAAVPAARYVVQPGDTLSGIAARFAVAGGWTALYAANRPLIGPDPGLIRPGTVLVLPGLQTPARYRVAAGDTLATIAAALAVPGGWPALYRANRRAIGPDPGLIRPGVMLTIPNPAEPRPAARPRPAASPAGPGPAPHRYLTPPSAAPAGSGHGSAPGQTAAPGGTGMPSWLTSLLLAAGLIIGVAFLAEPVLLIRRRRRRATRVARLAQAGAAAPPVQAGAAAPPAQARQAGPPATVPPQVPRQRGPQGRTAPKARVVLADYPRVVVTYHEGDGTVSVLRPPGHDPAAILKAARLVLPEGPYRELASQLGLPASWPIVVADYDRLVVTCSPHDGTVYVLRPPGLDPAAVLKAARLVLSEDPYEELAEQLGLPASLPVRNRRE
jgi:LysM repeat protein